MSKEVKILENIINRLIEERNDFARAESIEYFEDWSILKGTSRKLSQEEIEDYFYRP